MLKSIRRAFESQMTNANSTQVIVNTGLLDLDLSVLNNLFSRSGDSESSTQTSMPIKIKARSEKLVKRDSDAENSSDAMSEFVEQIFNKILINPMVKGNTINHTFDSDLLCTNETDTDLTDCIDLWSKARLVQQVIDDNSGTLAFQFEGASNPNNASLAGTITASLPADTILEVINFDTANEITKINTGGPLDITGTDFFSGNFQVLEGECMQESQTAVFGLAMVACP